MPKHILVTGSNGQLGKELERVVKNGNFNEKFYFTHRESLDISSHSAVASFCKDKNINSIVNCAAYTAVDKAQEDKDNANNINHLAVKNLAQVAKEQNTQLIHISTDYVFDGTNYQPYTEDDKVNPQSIYGQTKLDGENAIIAIDPKNSLIIRTSWVYSSFGANFVKTMMRLGAERDSLGVIFDQVGTPTYAKDLAECIVEILFTKNMCKSEKVEIYNYSNEGACSWYDFAKAIFDISHISCDVSPITTDQYPTPAKRPHYSILNKKKIKEQYGLNIPYWKDSLESCIEELQ